MRGPIGAATAFWHQMQERRNPFFTEHPYLAEMGDVSRVIPLGFHGDGGRFYKAQSLFVFSWNSLFATRSTLATRFVITLLRKDMVCPGTWEAIAKVIGWSLNVLLSGVEPEIDANGKPIHNPRSGYLADGWRGAMCKVRGDWEFFFRFLTSLLGQILIVCVLFAKQLAWQATLSVIVVPTKMLHGGALALLMAVISSSLPPLAYPVHLGSSL